MIKLPALTDIKWMIADAVARARLDSGANRGYHLLDRSKCIAVEIRDANGKVENFYPGESYYWDGTLTDIRRAIDGAAKHGEVVRWSVFGGFDAAPGKSVIQARMAHKDGDYDPLVGEWSVAFGPNGIPIDDGVYSDPNYGV